MLRREKTRQAAAVKEALRMANEDKQAGQQDNPAAQKGAQNGEK